MSVRPPLALTACVVAFAAALCAPAFGKSPASTPSPAASASPASSPSPASPLSQISLDPTPDPTSTGPYPRLLGHIVASAACTRFVEHYNAAATVMVANDQRIATVDTTLDDIANDYYKRDGALRAYDHRLQLIANVSQMLKTIPVEQAAVNDMLAQAKETRNPARQAALQESASQLQRSVDRQRALAYDLSTVAHVLLDKHGYEDTFASRISQVLPPGMHFNLNPGDDPVPQPGDGPLNTRSGPPKNQTTAQDILQYSRQKFIIGAAETKAAGAASRVVSSCVHPPDSIPQPVPSP